MAILILGVEEKGPRYFGDKFIRRVEFFFPAHTKIVRYKSTNFSFHFKEFWLDVRRIPLFLAQ